MINSPEELAEALRTPAVQDVLRRTMAEVIRQESGAWSPDLNTTDSKRESSVGVHGHVHQASIDRGL